MAINNSKQVLFVDSRVENYQDFVNNVTSGIEVVVLNGSRDGITQITEALTGREGITSVQIISHGGEGEIRLGTTLLNSANLQEYSEQLQQWRKALTAEADILLFGCNVASGVGEDFIRNLSEVTGADVAASTDVTGNAKLGGDWDLEVQTGSIESSLAISEAVQQSYTNVLALKAEYYNDKDKDVEGSLSQYKGTNIVDNINYGESNDDIPFLGGNDDRGIRWTGYVYAPNTGGYTFYADIDDGVVLYVNGQKIINQWNNGSGEYSGNISLAAGQWYPIEMKFQNNEGDWRAILSWSGPSISKQVIPADKFIVPNGVPPQKEQYLAVNDSEVNYSFFGYTLKSTGEGVLKKSSNNYYKFVPNPYQISVNASSTTVKEGETVNFTITSDRYVSEEVKVFYKIETISGADPSDVSIPQPQSLYYAKLSGNSATVSINIVDDQIGRENGEQFKLTLVPDPQSSDTYSINTSSTAVTIQDNEPIFELRQIRRATQEGGDSPQFRLTNTNPVRTNRDITFYYQIDLNSASDPKANLADFTTISSSVVFPSGASSQTFTLPIINDDKLYEGQTEYFRIVAVYSNEYSVNYDLVDYSLSDNEPQISLQNYRSQTQEGAPFSGSGDGLFQVNFSRATPQQFYLELGLDISNSKAATPGSFVATKKGSDYKIYYYLQSEGYQNRKYLIQDSSSSLSNLKIDVPAGNANQMIIGVEPIDDDIYDPDETVTLFLKDHATGVNQYYGIDPNQNRQTIIIRDNEPIVSLGNVVHPQEGFGYGSTIIGLEQALELKGTNSVNVASQSSLDLSKTGQFTQEAWIFANFTDNNRHGILGNGTTATSYAGISVINQTGIEVGFGDGTNWNSFQIDNLLSKNNWNHVATTFDGTEYSFYVNGLKVSSTTQFQGKIPTNASSFDIGKVGTNTFTGAIDEVRLWNVARTSAQINQNLITDLQGNEKGLIGYWQFNNNTQDKTANQNNGTASGTLNYIKNPATQIGYVDVTLDKDVTAPQGLWIAYSLGGTATSGQDYWSSQIRKVSSDPNSQLKGIVIPQGERSARIYFTALPDGIAESDETIQVNLIGYDFDRETRTYNQNASNYAIDPNNSSRTLTIQDNQAFQPGFVILNEFNEVVNASNPLSVKNGSVTFQVKLASQPYPYNPQILIKIVDFNSSTSYDKLVQFTTQNWNTPQPVTLENLTTAQTQLNIRAQDYQNVAPLTVPLTTNPSDKVRVTEGSSTDAVAITPEISIISGGNANETDAEGGQFTIRLKNPAPAAGLIVNYAVSGNATLNTDYAIAGSNVNAQKIGSITIAPGEIEATIAIAPIIDSQVEGNETVSITLQSSANYNIKSGVGNATLTLVDSDVAGVQLSNIQVITNSTTQAQNTTFSGTFNPLITEENRLGISTESAFGLRLSSKPSANVTITFSGLDATEGTLSKSSVIFTTANWDQYQTVTVTGVDDAEKDGDITYSVIGTTSSSDLQYQNKKIPIQITNLDNEKQILKTAEEIKTALGGDPTQVNTTLPLATIKVLNATAIEVDKLTGSAIAPQIEINLDKPAGTNGALVSFDLAGGSAIYGQDYNPLQNIFIEKTGTNNPFSGINAGTNSLPTFADIDNDGKIDLFIGTGNGLIKFYKNQGSTSNPLYVEQTGLNNPLNSAYVGSNAAPAFVDIDGDGDLDVFVGTRGRVSYYKNIGTATNPKFENKSGYDNPLDKFIDLNYQSVFPSFADINGDGTQDAIIGNSSYQTQVYPNFGGKNNPSFNFSNLYSQNSYVSAYSYNLPTYGVTTLFDVDFDGDLDLLSGSFDYYSSRFDGKIQTSRNDGYRRYQTLSGDANPFKDIAVAVKTNSIPAPVLVDLDGDTDQDIVLGSADGTLKYYQQVQAVKIAPGETKATITLQTLPDNIDEDDETIQVNLRAGDGYRIDATKSTAIVTLQDDSDTVGITITKPSSSTTSEGGSFLNYSIKLNSQPTKTVKVSLGTTDSSEGQLKSQSSDLSSVSVLNLEFTPDNWNKPQAFTVVAQDDAIDDDNIDYKIISTINSQDAKYDGLKVESLFLTNTDDDNFGLVITEPGQTSEGRTNIYGVRLKSQPTGEVRVTLTPSDDQIQFNQKSAGKPITLTFNAKTWNLEQSVQVLAVDDAVVEYFHTSQIKVTTESGKVLYGELDDAKNDIPTQATDLGTLKETLTLRDLAIGKSGDQDWYQFTLPDTGTVADYVQIDFNNALGDLDMKLYKASDLTNHIGKSSSDKNNSEKLNFNGLAPGKYYIQVYGFSGTTNPNYTLTLTNEDSKYNNFTGLTKDVYIVDNDLPTAKIIAGPSASELFGQPSYFSVSLSNPAPRNSLSQNGIAVNYRLVGGTASNGNDYQLISPTGTVLIAPGNIQNNLLIVPIDDKLAEGLNLKVTGRTVGAASNNQTQMTLTVETSLAASATLNQGAKLRFAKGVIGEVVSPVTLNPVSTGSNIYRATVSVNLNTFDVNSVQVNSLAKVAEETVTVELLAGDGYTLDNNNKIANIAIADDDVPGVRVVEVGYTTVAGESEAAQFEVSLLSEPSQDVKIRLTPGAEVEFVNPVNPTTVKVKKEVYTLNSFSSELLDVKLNGLVPTNKGDALTFDVRLKKQPFEIVTVTLTDGFDTTSQTTAPVTLTFTPDNWNQPQQSVVVSYLDRNSSGNYQINAQLKFDPTQTVKFDISDNSGDKYAIASSEVLNITLLTATPTEQGNNNFAVKLNNKPLGNVIVILADGFETAGKTTTAKTLNFTTQNWNVAQNVTLANLDKNSSDDYQIKANVTGNVVTNSALNLGITHSQIDIDKQTTELTFKAQDWYKLQPIAVKGSDDTFSEPNLYHISNVDYQVTSADSGYNNFFVPQQTVFVVDRILSPQETSSTLKEGLGLLQESLGSLTVPILGGLDDIAPDLVGEFSGKLTSAIAKEENLTAIRLKEIIEGILGTLGAKSFDVEVEVNEDEVTVDLNLSKTYDLFKLSLDGNNLGLPALGISLTTKGELVSTFDYNLSLGFGLSKDFGFFIDTKKTGFHAGIDVGLSQDFTGQGNLSFLRLDFNNDPNNLSKLSFTVDAKLKDLDNHLGIRFFDVNGNGILDTAPFSFDLNKNGTIETTEQNLKEPFTQISATGTYTELKPLATDPLDVNKDGKFNQAKYQKQEGIYRIATDATTGANTYYFDVNRNGKLDKDATGKAIEPSTINTTLFNTEFLLKKTTPMAAIGTVAVPEYYIDFNNNNILDVGEKVNKAWDKNNDLKLNADINEIGEGEFINDVSIAFRDTNNNKQYDSGEKSIYSEFNPLEIDDEAKSEDGTYIDVDQDGIYAPDTWDVKILTAQNNGQQTYFLDINRNGILDKYEPQSTSSFDPLEIPDSDETVTIVDPLKPEDGKNALITLNILGTGASRYIDQNNDGVYKAANDTLINIKVDLPDEIAKRAGIKASNPLGEITLKDIFRISDIDTSITFLDVDGDKKLDIGITGNPNIYQFEPKLWVQDGKRFVDLDFNGELTLNKQDFNGQLTLNKQDFNGQFTLKKQGASIEPFADVSNEFLLEALKPATGQTATGSIVKLLDDGDRLTIAELKNFKNDPNLSFNDLIKYEFAGNANLGLNTKTSIEGNPAFPSLAFDLSLNLPLYNYGNQEQAQKQGLSVDFNNVTLDFGSFLTNFIRPMMAATDKILDPIKPIVELLNADTKLLSYIKLDSVFNADGKPGISLLDIAKTLAPLNSDPKTKEKIDKAIKFADTLTQIIEIVDSLNNLPTNESIILDMGSHSLSDLKAASSQQKDATAAIKVPDTGAGTVTGTGTTVTTKQPTTNPTAQAGATTQSSILSKLQKLEGLQFPILSNPVTILRLLLGEKDVDLVKYDIPDFDFSFDIKETTPIAPPLPLLAVVEGNFSAKTDLSVGYDTHGLEAWKDEDFALDEIYKVFDGFYVDDLGADGKEKPELLVNGNIKAGLAATALIITATVQGGISGKISLDLVDEGELNGTSDGKIRGSEIISRLDTPLELFNLNGLIEAFLGAKVEVGIGALSSTVWETNFAKFKLAEFNVGASGNSFSSDLSGSISNSYIRGATVFFDVNFNGQWDDGEPITFTDGYGQYSLDIGLLDRNGDGEFNQLDGQIISIGGYDTSSGLPGGKFVGLPSSTIITPLTSLQVPLVQSGLTLADAEALIKQQLGLDANFSLETFDSLKEVGQKQALGLDIYLAHIRIQTIFNHAQALIDGLEIADPNVEVNPNNSQIVEKALAEYLKERAASTSEPIDFSNAAAIAAFYTFLGQKTSITPTSAQLNIAAQILADSNKLLDKVAEVGASKSIEEALPALAAVKRVVQGEIAGLVKQLAAGSKTGDVILTDFAATLYQNYTLVDADINAFGNRLVTITAVTKKLSEANNGIAEFLVQLSQAAPNQGLKLVYSLSGTATLNADYRVNAEKVGELYIAPGESSGKIFLSAIDDLLSEPIESITINLKSVGEGYLINPTAAVALISIEDDEPNLVDQSVTGIVYQGTLGNDTFSGDLGNDKLEGSYGNDVLDGKAGNDILRGANGEDTLIGGDGDDKLEGGFGDDILAGNAGNDILDGGAGNNQLKGGEGADILYGGTGNDTLEGNAGNDQIEGGKGNDILQGNENNDWLVGDDGNDILTGGTGDDILNGGDGADVFFFNSPQEGFDTLLDFNPAQGDKIQISASGFGVNNLNDFRFISGVLDFKGQNLGLIQNQGATYAYFPNLSQIIEIVDAPTAISEAIVNNTIQTLTPAAPDSIPLVVNTDPSKQSLLDKIIQRGTIKYAASNSNTAKFDVEFVKAIAAALFGDANKIEPVITSFSESFTQVANQTVDLSSRRVTNDLVRDGELNVDFGPIYLYDSQAILVRADSNINNAKDLQGRKVGMITSTTSLGNLQNLLTPEGIQFTPKLYQTEDEMFAAYEAGEVDAVSRDKALLYSRLSSLSQPQNQRILDVEFSKEPIAFALPENESEWADVVRWVTYATMQAEEFGITSQNIDALLAKNTDSDTKNDSDAAIRRFLGLQDNLGQALGIRKDFAVQIIKQIGNYGEIYQRYFPGLERDRNLLAKDGGLLYSPPLSGNVPEVTLTDNDDRHLLAEVLQRGYLKVGTSGQAAGFSSPQADGKLAGFDIDLSRALAAALFGNPDAVQFTTQNNLERFTNAANGIVDVSIQEATENLVRDASLGIDYGATYFYDGQGVLVKKDSGISTLAMLNGRKVGLLDGTTSIQNLQDASEKFGVVFTSIVFPDETTLFQAYEQGEVDAVSTDISLLSTTLSSFSHPEEHKILNEVLSKEPLSLVVDENQSEWADVVRWVTNSLLQAEEYGITSQNIDEFIGKNTDDNKANDSNPVIQVFLGLRGNIGASLGLPNDFVVKMIKAVGNYGEIYAHNFDTNLLPRQKNELYKTSGLQYPLPLGVNAANLNGIVIAKDDIAETTANIPVNIQVLNNDKDLDDDALTLSIVSAASQGTVQIKDNATPDDHDDFIIYTPKSNFTGIDKFTYQVSDGKGASAQAQVNVTINPAINHTPTLQNAIADQIAKEDTVFSFTFDTNTFIDVDAGDNLTYSATLKDGSNLPNWLKFNAATRTFIGTPTNADFGNLTIELRAKDNNGVSATDTFALAVEHNNSTPSFKLSKIADDIFKISNSSGKSKLKVTLTESSSNLVNELGVFTVDDAQGNINGIAPGAAGYTQAALERSQVIFSAIANPPNGFNANNLSHLLEFNSSDNLRFYLVKNSSIDALRAGVTPLTDILFSDPLTQKITDLGADQFSLAWKDSSGNSTADFKDMVVKIQTTNDPLPLGTNLQGKPQGEVIDLRGVTSQVKADFVVNREAAFNNFIGFYQVTDENGGIDTNGDGKADILTGQAGYTEAAIRGRVAGIDLRVNNQGTATYTGTFQPGSIFAPFIIANGSPDALLDSNPNNNPAVYFPFLGANTDKVDHIRLLGNNVFGFEDLANGGDKDFNDVIVGVTLSM